MRLRVKKIDGFDIADVSRTRVIYENSGGTKIKVRGWFDPDTPDWRTKSRRQSAAVRRRKARDRFVMWRVKGYLNEHQATAARQLHDYFCFVAAALSAKAADTTPHLALLPPPTRWDLASMRGELTERQRAAVKAIIEIRTILSAKEFTAVYELLSGDPVDFTKKGQQIQKALDQIATHFGLAINIKGAIMFVTATQIRQKYGVTDYMIAQMIAAGEFPKPQRATPKARKLWVAAEVERAMKPVIERALRATGTVAA